MSHGILTREIKFKPTVAYHGAVNPATTFPLATARQALSLLPVAYRIQPKLHIGSVNDRYEREADQVADQVMRMPDNAATVPNTFPVNSTRHVYAASQRDSEAGNTIQGGVVPVHNPTITPDIDNGMQSLKGRGQPLAEPSRRFFEHRFGYDFSKVRIHADNRAANLANSIQAMAFTLGNNVVFGTGQYQPYSREGRYLMAHELTHVVQQGNHETMRQRVTRDITKNTLRRGEIIQRRPMAEEQRLQRPEVQPFLQTPSLFVFPQHLSQALSQVPSYASAQAMVNWWGYKLWEQARLVSQQQGHTDDRPLYWIRLRMRQIIQTFNPGNRFTLSPAQREQLVAGFEAASRGMPTGRGRLAWIPTAKRILISGFDPFGLSGNPRDSNPSAAVALNLDGQIIRNGQVTAQIQSVIFPVRFSYFDQGNVESFFRPYLSGPNQVDMVMTISQGRTGYEIEEWAGNARTTTYPDNEALLSQRNKIIPGGPNRLRTTLPYSRMTSVPGTRLNSQSPNQVTGTGGTYLSNEIFYRVRNLQTHTQGAANIPIGHLHIPMEAGDIGAGPRAPTINQIIARVREIIVAALPSI